MKVVPEDDNVLPTKIEQFMILEQDLIFYENYFRNQRGEIIM
jgi:hypothetical protein